jgi:hypothetical protein
VAKKYLIVVNLPPKIGVIAARPSGAKVTLSIDLPDLGTTMGSNSGSNSASISSWPGAANRLCSQAATCERKERGGLKVSVKQPEA